MKKPVFIDIKELFPRLYNIIPGWLQGVIHCVTAGTAVGKTKFVKYAFLFHSYTFCKKNNLPFYCIWFALEEDEETFWTSILCDLLYIRYGLTLTYYQFMGYHEGRTEEHDKAILELQPELDEMKKVVTVVDYVSNPTGIYKTFRKFMESLGTRKDDIDDIDDFGNKYNSFTFTYHNPNTQVLFVIDHMTLLTPEKSQFGDAGDKHKAITKMSEYLIKFIAKRYLSIPVIIHQQEATSGNAEDQKMQRSEPTLDKLGVNKIVAQEYQVVLGLFNPQGVTPPINHFGGYDTKKFGDNFRSLRVLKHRKGQPDKITGLYFHGATNRYEELPPPLVKVGERFVENPELVNYYNNN